MENQLRTLLLGQMLRYQVGRAIVCFFHRRGQPPVSTPTLPPSPGPAYGSPEWKEKFKRGDIVY